jgi:type II secretory pathway pseudopilin PulG
MRGSGVSPKAGARAPHAHVALAEFGFTFIELLVGLTLFAGIAVFLLQAFLAGMTYANRSDTQAAATSIAVQIMEQIKASPNPYSMVGFTNIARTPLPLPAPYTGIANPTPHTFQVSVAVTPDNNLIMSTVTVNVYQPSDAGTAPTATLTTVLDAQ